MRKLDLTTKLYIRVILLVSVLLLIVIAYSQWLSLQEGRKEYEVQLEIITEYLEKTIPANFIVEISEQESSAGKGIQEQVLAVNKEIQPLLNNILVPNNIIKFGVYSLPHQRIIAIGPEFDASLLVGIQSDWLHEFYKSNEPKLGQIRKSIVWYGAPVVYHVRPIVSNGKVIGHVFAAANMNIIYDNVWTKMKTTFFAWFIALLAVIMLFQEVLIRLKKDLGRFAEEIIKGRAEQFESEMPELTPVLHYISEQTTNMARLERLNIIGEMAASIGHEVRNPMTTVRGYLQYLSDKEEFKSRKEYFTLMLQELDRANSIITEFLSLAKNKTMNFKDSNLNEIVKELFPLIQADALRNNCQVETHLEEIPMVRLDESTMRQVILNMVRNSIESMPQGGLIEISTAVRAERVLLVIKDSGSGISAELLDKLGTPFFTTKESGTGLGLAVCYRIIERHNATITVDSEIGKGTSFTIEFNYN